MLHGTACCTPHAPRIAPSESLAPPGHARADAVRPVANEQQPVCVPHSLRLPVHMLCTTRRARTRLRPPAAYPRPMQSGPR
eukprot:7058924-Prymnesium_polylepis.2